MTGAISDDSQTGVSGQGRRRARQPVPRTRQVEVTLTSEEYAVIEAAARRSGTAEKNARRTRAATSTSESWGPVNALLTALIRPRASRWAR
jgi:hypothetical protein